MKTSVRPELTLDLVGPFRGLCGVCGGPDARHRRFDAIQERALSDTPEEIAGDFALSVDAVRAVIAAPRWREPRRT
jgi:hypothetical protein